MTFERYFAVGRSNKTVSIVLVSWHIFPCVILQLRCSIMWQNREASHVSYKLQPKFTNRGNLWNSAARGSFDYLSAKQQGGQRLTSNEFSGNEIMEFRWSIIVPCSEYHGHYVPVTHRPQPIFLSYQIYSHKMYFATHDTETRRAGRDWQPFLRRGLIEL